MRSSFKNTVAESKVFKQVVSSAATGRDFSKKIYRSNGFEAWVVGETDTAWEINDMIGVHCMVHKHTTKKSIFKVGSDYVLRS